MIAERGALRSSGQGGAHEITPPHPWCLASVSPAHTLRPILNSPEAATRTAAVGFAHRLPRGVSSVPTANGGCRSSQTRSTRSIAGCCSLPRALGGDKSRFGGHCSRSVRKSPKYRSPESPKEDVLAAALRHRGSACRPVSTTRSETQWAREISAPPAVRPCLRGSPAPPGPPCARSGHCR